MQIHCIIGVTIISITYSIIKCLLGAKIILITISPLLNLYKNATFYLEKSTMLSELFIYIIIRGGN